MQETVRIRRRPYPDLQPVFDHINDWLAGGEEPGSPDATRRRRLYRCTRRPWGEQAVLATEDEAAALRRDGYLIEPELPARERERLAASGFELPALPSEWSHVDGRGARAEELRRCLARTVALARGRFAPALAIELDAGDDGRPRVTFVAGEHTRTWAWASAAPASRPAIEVLAALYGALNDFVAEQGSDQRFAVMTIEPHAYAPRLLLLGPAWRTAALRERGLVRGCFDQAAEAEAWAGVPEPRAYPARAIDEELGRLPLPEEIVGDHHVQSSDYKCAARETDLPLVFGQIAAFAGVPIAYAPLARRDPEEPVPARRLVAGRGVGHPHVRRQVRRRAADRRPPERHPRRRRRRPPAVPLSGRSPRRRRPAGDRPTGDRAARARVPGRVIGTPASYPISASATIAASRLPAVALVCGHPRPDIIGPVFQSFRVSPTEGSRRLGCCAGVAALVLAACTPLNRPHDAGADAPLNQDAANDTSVTDMTAETPIDTPPDTSTDTAVDVPGDVRADVAADMAVDVPGDIRGDIAGDIPADMAADTPADVPADIAADTVADVPGDIPTEAPGDARPGTGCTRFTRGPTMVAARMLTKPICVDATEVTQGQYQQFLTAKDGDTSGQAPECEWNLNYAPPLMCSFDPTGHSSFPVNGVDWCDATAYCKWAGKRLCGGLTGGLIETSSARRSRWPRSASGPPSAHTAANAAIPTARRSTARRATAASTRAPRGRSLPSGRRPDDEGGFPGIFDLDGNVHEWENACFPLAGPPGRTDQCWFRGGSYHDLGSSCSSAFQVSRDYVDYLCDIGFRCCADPS